MPHDPIDVVDPEPYPLEVEGGDRAIEGFRFLDQTVELILGGRGPHHGEELSEAALSRLAIFGGHDAMIVNE